MSLSRPARRADPGLPARPMSTFPLGPRRVRRSGYGAMQLAGPWAVNAPPDRASAIGVLRAAVAAGIDHIDTAQYYGPDVVNDLIREALYPYPRELAIVSKVGVFKGRRRSPRRARQLRAESKTICAACGSTSWPRSTFVCPAPARRRALR